MNKIYGISGLLLFICVYTALKNPDFLSPFNLQNNLKWIAFFGILAIGVAFVIMTAGIDLSIGSVVGLTGCLLGMFLLEDVKRIDSYAVLAASGTDNNIHLRAAESGLSPGDLYLHAGVVHRVDAVAAGENVFDDNGKEWASSIVSVSPSPKEEKANPAVRVHVVQAADQVKSMFTLEGEHAQLEADDKVSFVVAEDGDKTKVVTFDIDSARVSDGSTQITVDEDLRRIAPSDWETIAGAKHAMLLKRSAPMSVPVAIIVVLLVSAGIGVFHGISITKFGMQPFIVTLCGLLFYRGIAREITVDQTQGFGTGYQELKLLASGKPFTMAFLILIAGLMQVAWYAFKRMNAKRGGETNLKPYAIGMAVGLALTAIGSSRYIFAYLPIGQQEIASQHWMAEESVVVKDGKITLRAHGLINTLDDGGIVFVAPKRGDEPLPVNVKETWVYRNPGNPDAEPITNIVVESNPVEGKTLSYEEDTWPTLTVGYRVMFVDPLVNEVIITGDHHRDLIRGDTLDIRAGGAVAQMVVLSTKATKDNSQTIVTVNAVPAGLDRTSAVTMSLRNPRPQKIPGFLFIVSGTVLMLLGLVRLVPRVVERKWATLRMPIMMTVGGGAAVLVGMTPIPLIEVPMPFVIMVVFALVAGVFVNQTIYGRYILALGRNEQAARYSGINTDRMIILTYVLCSLAAGVGGILFALELNSIGPSSQGNFYELYAIAGAVLGGCSLRGGEGSILGVVIGVAVMRVLLNAVNILGIASRLEFAIIGAVIFLGVLVDEMVRRWAAKRRAAREARLAMMGE